MAGFVYLRSAVYNTKNAIAEAVTAEQLKSKAGQHNIFFGIAAGAVLALCWLNRAGSKHGFKQS
jgi:hypothetical protein